MKGLWGIIGAVWLALACTLPAAAENLGILTEVRLPEGADYAVIDVMDGVEARYRLMTHADYTGEYSCAGFIKAYYEAVYGVFVDNLTDQGPPRGRGLAEDGARTRDIFTRADTPQKGDIIFYASPPQRNNHSAIVKSFDGALITLIEQNFKWAQAGGTYTWYDRTIPYARDGNPYEIWRLAGVPAAPAPTLAPQPTAEPAPTLAPEPTAEPAAPAPEPTAAPTTPTTPKPDFYVDDNPVIYEVTIGDDGEEETVPAFSAQPEENEDGPVTAVVVEVTIGSLVISVNGQPSLMIAPPYIESGLTMLPVRSVGYALGIQPEHLLWDGPTRSVLIYNGGDTIRFAIDSKLFFVNDRPTEMHSAAVLRDGVSYLPVRYLAEALGVPFEWDGPAATVRFRP